MKGAGAFFFEGNEIGVLICHGFNGTPQSVRYLGECLSEQGFTVYAPRLEGHGTDPHEMEKCHYKDWINSVKMAVNFLKSRCLEVFMIGQSMGGTLALTLASENCCKLTGIITINAALSVPGYECFRHDFSKRFIPEDVPDIKQENVVEIVYDSVPTRAIRNLLALMDQSLLKLSSISCPTLLLKSKIDHVVPPTCTDMIYNEIQSCQKRIVTLENSYHVASLDHDRQKIVDDIIDFIHQHSSFSMNIVEISNSEER